ncbi:DUF3515 domain-containing protein [Streptomyces aidingensis]|uniref:DUF3515 domain-containing protein n=1 Tax=Streptomyces aidingensis TaxID=910347 RepID=A0A1I1NR11_9ACTN|nr:DUF3515 domain-containing protein [Streptomyces aidingensis]SFC99732.1 Protein of unknown function [Streptomyces aidingensis]
MTAAALSLLAMAGPAACTSSSGLPEPEPPAPEGEAARACRSLYAALPEHIEDQPRRPLSEETEYAAAWGDPSITLRCGTGRPAVLDPAGGEYNPAADAVVVNDVAWLAEERPDGYRFTTTERTVWVEVTVARELAPEVSVLVDLAAPVAEHIPLDPLWESYYDDDGAQDGADAGDGRRHAPGG